MPKGRAEGLQQAATKRLVTAATLWRRDPDNPELTAALIAAIDEPMAHSMRTTRVVDSRGSSRAGTLAGFGACLILWWVVDRHRRGR